MTKPNTSLIGIAGVHYVVSELSRRGVIALPTVKNTAAYDIVAISVRGTKHANIQVKASSKRVTFFPMPPPERIRTGRNDYFVLARWIESESKYQCYLLSGRQAKAEVHRAIKSQQRTARFGTRVKLFPSAHVGPSNAAAAQRWSKAWAKWKL
jgi:hypothetical protein